MTRQLATDGTAYRADTESTVDSIRAATAVGAWLALTVLFTAAGSVLVVTGATAVIPAGTPALTVVTLAGLLGATGASPILAEETVRRSVGSLRTTREAVRAVETGGWLTSSSETSEEPHRQSCCA